MILTKEQVEKRIESEDNIANKKPQTVVIYKDGKNHFGRREGKNLSEEDKVAIGVLANLEGNKLAAEMFGVSESHAQHLRIGQETTSHGAGTQGTAINQDLKNKIQDRIDDTKLTAQEKAAERLLKALGCITDDKLENANLKDVAAITNSMSQVMRNLSPNQNNKDGKSSVRVVINQPKQIKEESFDVIEIGVG